MSIINPTGCNACHIGEHKQGGIAVPGIGNPHADIMFIGEAPGKEEAQVGEPFIGLSGQALTEMMRIAGIQRTDCYITNICKCWPYEQVEDDNGFLRNNNRAPTPTEMENCRRFLDAEIEAVNPKVIVVLGNTPLAAIEGKDNARILSRRGQPFLYKNTNIFVMPTMHPSYVLRNGGVWGSTKEITPTAKTVISDLVEAVNLSKGKIQIPEKLYRLIDCREALMRVHGIIKERGRCTFDIETTGLSLTDKIIGIGLAIDVGTACYIPFLYEDLFSEEPVNYWADKDITREEVIAVLKDVLEDEAVEKSAHNAKFDMGLLQTDFGITVKGLGWDTMCGAYLIDENSEHDLKTLKNRYIDLLGYEDEWNSLTNKGKNAIKAPLPVAVNYCCSDADATYRLTKEQKIFFQTMPNYQWLMDNFYVPVMYIVRDMEVNGVAYDVNTALKVKEKLLIEQEKAKNKIYEALPDAGKFNIDSDDQVRKVLYGVMGLKPPFETKGNQHKKERSKKGKKVLPKKSIKQKTSDELENALSDFGDSFESKQTDESKGSTDKKALEVLAKDNPIVREIVQYRHCGHIITTYIDGRIKIVDANGRVHISLNPTGTDTGRFSSKGSQNIPRDPTIKGLHIAPPGSKLVSVDLSQAEVRGFAHYANEDVLREAFSVEGIDVHTMVASQVRGIPYDVMMEGLAVGNKEYKAMRNAAKGTVFGLLYGRGARSIAAEYGMTLEEAETFIIGFFGRFPNCKKWIDDTHAFVAKNGYVYNLFGRVRHLPWVFSDDNETVAKAKRQAVNSIVQATAADITNLALIRIATELKRNEIPGKIVLQVHDNIVTEAPDEYVSPVEKLMVEIMEMKPHPEFTIKMKADADIYQAWGVH